MTTDPVASASSPMDVPRENTAHQMWREIPLTEGDQTAKAVPKSREPDDVLTKAASERGAVLAEYGMLIAMIALFVVSSLLFFTPLIQNIFLETNDGLNAPAGFIAPAAFTR